MENKLLPRFSRRHRGLSVASDGQIRPPKIGSMRILHVIASLNPEYGGPSVTCLSTALGVRSQSVYNVFATVARPDQLPDIEHALSLLRSKEIGTFVFPPSRAVPRLGARLGISLAFARWLFRVARTFDVIHCHATWTFTTTAVLAVGKLRRRVIVLSTNESLTWFDVAKSRIPKRTVKRALRWIVLHSFDVIITSSEMERRDSGGAYSARMIAIPHAGTPIAAAPIPPDRPGLVVGYIGRLHAKKNVELLIEALSRLPEEVRLRIAGDGPADYRGRLEALAANLGVAKRIDWLGFVAADGKPAFFESVDVVAMPSDYECFGLSAVEALYAGRPVLISGRAGVAEALAQHGCGLVVEPELPAVVEGLARLAGDRGLLLRLAASARPTAEAQYSVESHGRRVVAAYEAALARRKTTTTLELGGSTV